MNARRAVLALVLVLLAVPAVALAAGARFTGKAGKTFIGIQTKGSGKHITKIKHFEFEGPICGGDTFTGGNSKPIKVAADGTFHSKQPVGGVQVKLTMRVKGRFTDGGTKAHGTLKITGACKSGKRKWSATEDQGPQQGY